MKPMKQKNSFSASGARSSEGKVHRDDDQMKEHINHTLMFGLAKMLRVDNKSITQITDWFKIPAGFPRQVGLRLYNEDRQKLVHEFEKAVSSGEQEKVSFDKDAPGTKLLASALFVDYIRTFREMTDRAIAGQKPTKEDLRALENALLKKYSLVPTKSEETGRFYPVVSSSESLEFDLAWWWIFGVWTGQIEVRRCKAGDCNKIFVPVRSDQQYCSKRCAKRVWAQGRMH